jgi:hypothetical protein
LKNSTNSWETSTWEKQGVTWILTRRTSPPKSGGVSGNIDQVCIIITEAAKENNDAGNLVVDTQGKKPRSNSGKEKEKIYVSAGEWRIIMSAINHGTDVPANSRREVLMGYQYALHQRKKKLRAEKKRAYEKSGEQQRIKQIILE